MFIIRIKHMGLVGYVRKIMMESEKVWTMTGEELNLFCERFEIPLYLSRFVSRLFSEEEFRAALTCQEGRFAVGEYERDWLTQEYRKGFLNKTEDPDVYQLGNLYGMLDVFVVSRKDEYDRLFSIEDKHCLDDWYFDAYFSRLSPDEEGRLTEDKVMTLEEAIGAIRADPRPIYLNYCDCRSLTGDCGKPTHTCLTYKNGINSFVDRGLSQPLTKEEAVKVVEMADKNGLMHTTMSGGFCNCCSDCCYLFRSQRRAGTWGIWPATSLIVSYDEKKCIGCGLCVKRCWMKVFDRSSEDRKKILFDPAQCAGCGLCVHSCPAKALSLVERLKGGTQVPRGGEGNEL